MSQDSFFLTPAMTEQWGEVPAADLAWNPTTDLPFLLDGDTTMVEADAQIIEEVSKRGTTPERQIADAQGICNTEIAELDHSVSIGERLAHVLKAVSTAGFNSLDDAVVAYYTESCEDHEWLQQTRRLNRIRQLPTLVEKMHHEAQTWDEWQRRGFEEQIIRSTEDILIAELFAMQHSCQSSSEKQARNSEAEVSGAYVQLNTEYELSVMLTCGPATQYVDFADVTIFKV